MILKQLLRLNKKRPPILAVFSLIQRIDQIILNIPAEKIVFSSNGGRLGYRQLYFGETVTVWVETVFIAKDCEMGETGQ